MADTQLVELDEQPTAVIRAVIATNEIVAFFDRAFGAVMQTLAAQGVAPAGPPFALYHGMPTDTIELEAGFPVAAAVEPAGDVVPGTLPGGRAVQAMHQGPYDTLPTTYAEVRQRLAEEGFEPGPHVWECYLTDPQEQPDPETWQTLVVWPAA
ncbi:MAG TPA: GyrI-like domain-containing protein [Microlunatus sp.]|nr:GyrI-like domain-containing protein [Microlunatus sp.]